MSDHSSIFEAKAATEIEELNDRISSCSLARGVAVLGSGNPLADIFLAKLAADDEEETAGIAFAGRSGNAILRAAERLHLCNRVLYGTNLVKCLSADPACGTECHAYFYEELAVVQPAFVFAMGEVVFAAACRALGHEADFAAGVVVRRGGRPTLIASVDFEHAMTDEEAKRQLWNDLKLLAAECRKGQRRLPELPREAK